MASQPPKVWISVRLNEDQFQLVRQYASKFELCRSDVVRQALRLGIAAIPKSVRRLRNGKTKTGREWKPRVGHDATRKISGPMY